MMLRDACKEPECRYRTRSAAGVGRADKGGVVKGSDGLSRRQQLNNESRQ